MSISLCLAFHEVHQKIPDTGNRITFFQRSRFSPLTKRLKRHSSKRQNLFSCHGGPTLRAALLIAGSPQLMRHSFTTVGADAITSRACRKATSLAPATTALTSSHAPTCSRALSSWACSVSSWHFIYLLPNTATVHHSPLSVGERKKGNGYWYLNSDFSNCLTPPTFLCTLGRANACLLDLDFNFLLLCFFCFWYGYL